jgi:hypothetical protein
MADTRSSAEIAAAHKGLRDSLKASCCRRGDVIAWAQVRDNPAGDEGSRLGSMTVYTIGVITSVERNGGLPRYADTGFGKPQRIMHDIESAAVPFERIDLDAARAWLKSDQNWPRGGQPLLSLDDVRAVVRQWFKPETP